MAIKNVRVLGNTLWILAIWSLMIVLGAATGFMEKLAPSFIACAVIIAFIVMIVPYFRDRGVKIWVRDFGLRKLTAFHVWRIFAAFIFFTYFREGALPEFFVSIAGWGDLIVGALAAIVVSLPFNVMRYVAFHVIGLVDLIIAVSLGMTLMCSGVGEMENILTLPAALIVFLGVPLSAAVHVFALDMMKKATVDKH